MHTASDKVATLAKLHLAPALDILALTRDIAGAAKVLMASKILATRELSETRDATPLTRVRFLRARRRFPKFYLRTN